MNSLQETIGNPEWVVDNYTRLRDIFPVQRTLMSQGDMLRIGFAMKLVGVDWRSEAELSQAMVLCYHLGMFDQEIVNRCVYVTRSEAKMPPPKFFHMSAAQIQVNRLLRSEPGEDVKLQAALAIRRVMDKARE